MNRRHVAVVIGTRPEAIKLLPVIRACRERDDLRVTFIATAQHRDMLDQVTSAWGVSPDVDLDVMQPKQDLTDVTTNILRGMRSTLVSLAPDVVVLQGDTTTTFAGALASFYAKIPVAHVEAGLRTGQKYAPFPEEINRRATTTLTDLHFAPTERSRQNLLAEGVADSTISVTGNTGVDALLYMRDRLRGDTSLADTFAQKFAFLRPGRRLVLVTAHRRESFGPGFEEICTGIRETCERWPDVDVVYPVHLNPSVREPVDRILRTGNASQRVHLLEPLSYPEFVYLLDRCDLVLTDSGGVQEEAPAIGKPVLVMRDVTERPEAVDAGAAILVGARRQQIVEAVSRLLGDGDAYRAMARPRFPFGDGHASARIAQTLATTTLQ
jgi:UDP-N-acetylglucosamine 2-epimerase (non-hydrolysing)